MTTDDLTPEPDVLDDLFALFNAATRGTNDIPVHPRLIQLVVDAASEITTARRERDAAQAHTRDSVRMYREAMSEAALLQTRRLRHELQDAQHALETERQRHALELRDLLESHAHDQEVAARDALFRASVDHLVTKIRTRLASGAPGDPRLAAKLLHTALATIDQAARRATRTTTAHPEVAA